MIKLAAALAALLMLSTAGAAQAAIDARLAPDSVTLTDNGRTVLTEDRPADPSTCRAGRSHVYRDLRIRQQPGGS